MPVPSPASGPTRPRLGLFVVRYGLGAILVGAGFVVLVVNPGGFGVDGFAMAVGSGLSVLMLNWLYRLGVKSDEERVDEEQARIYLAEHGRWPDDPPGPRRKGPHGHLNAQRWRQPFVIALAFREVVHRRLRPDLWYGETTSKRLIPVGLPTAAGSGGPSRADFVLVRPGAKRRMCGVRSFLA
jgi:hypothetical protein